MTPGWSPHGPGAKITAYVLPGSRSRPGLFGAISAVKHGAFFGWWQLGNLVLFLRKHGILEREKTWFPAGFTGKWEVYRQFMAVLVGNIISHHATMGLHYLQTPDTNNRHFENDHDHDCPRFFLFHESHSPFRIWQTDFDKKLSTPWRRAWRVEKKVMVSGGAKSFQNRSG